MRPALLFHHRRLFSGTGSKFKVRKSRKPDTWITRKQRSASEMKLNAKPVCSWVLPDRGRCKVLTQRGHTQTLAVMHQTLLHASHCRFLGSCLKQGCLLFITLSLLHSGLHATTRHVVKHDIKQKSVSQYFPWFHRRIWVICFDVCHNYIWLRAGLNKREGSWEELLNL